MPAITAVIPVLHVSSSRDAEAFYCGRLGFQREFAYRPHEGTADPGYIGVVRDRVRLHLSSFAGDGVPGAAVCVYVDDVDAMHGELAGAAVSIDTAPTDQTWGTREMYVKDADGNSIRFVQQRRSA